MMDRGQFLTLAAALSRAPRASTAWLAGSSLDFSEDDVRLFQHAMEADGTKRRILARYDLI